MEKTIFYELWYANDRSKNYDKIANNFLAMFDGSFIFGGYVRAQFDDLKTINDLDVAVKNDDYKLAVKYLKNMGCKEGYESYKSRSMRGHHSRFRCPKSISVDLMDHERYKELLKTAPSDIHYMVKNKNGFDSYDRQRFTRNELMEGMLNKFYHPLLPDQLGCEKLRSEGFISVPRSINKHLNAVLNHD